VAPSLAKSLPLPRILRRLVGELVIADRERRGSDFAHVARWPERIGGFEDLTFLFSSTVLAHGIASLRFDEAALLYRLVRELQPNLVVEIGRYRGGSTLLLAAALDGKGIVHSYDIDTRQGRDGNGLDRELVAALERFGLRERVELHVADSRTVRPPSEPIDVLFVDGDHSEEGVRADFEHWSPRVRVGGHVLFHDAVATADFTSPADAGPARVAAEMTPDFVQLDGAGSLAHFVRRH
jgi:predicted O-methyltransferase YrrM